MRFASQGIPVVAYTLVHGEAIDASVERAPQARQPELPPQHDRDTSLGIVSCQVMHRDRLVDPANQRQPARLPAAQELVLDEERQVLLAERAREGDTRQHELDDRSELHLTEEIPWHTALLSDAPRDGAVVVGAQPPRRHFVRMADSEDVGAALSTHIRHRHLNEADREPRFREAVATEVPAAQLRRDVVDWPRVVMLPHVPHLSQDSGEQDRGAVDVAVDIQQVGVLIGVLAREVEILLVEIPLEATTIDRDAFQPQVPADFGAVITFLPPAVPVCQNPLNPPP